MICQLYTHRSNRTRYMISMETATFSIKVTKLATYSMLISICTCRYGTAPRNCTRSFIIGINDTIKPLVNRCMFIAVSDRSYK